MSNLFWTLSLVVVVGCGSTTDSTEADSATPDSSSHDGATPETAVVDGASGSETTVLDTALVDTALDAGDSDDAATDAPCPSTMGVVVDGLADALCKPTDDCCKAAGLANDIAKCRDQVRDFMLPYFDGAACGGSVVDMSRMADCYAALHDYNAACRNRYDIYESVVMRCNRAMSGTKKLGDTCESALECPQPSAAGDSVCDDWSIISPSGTTTGKQCVQELMVGEGASCKDWESPPPLSFNRCDVTKDLDCIGGICVARAVAGGSCASYPCAKGFACNDAKKCVVPIDDGSACSSAAPCGPESACKAGVCRHLAANGEACMDNSDCLPDSGGCVAAKCTPKSFLTEYFAKSSTTCIP